MGLMKILTDYKEKVSEDFIVEDIDAILKYYPNIDKDVALKVLALDPTFKPNKNSAGTYGKWLLKLFANGVELLDMSEKVTKALSGYDDLKKRNKLQPDQKDINRFKTVDDIQAILDANKEAVEKNDVQIEAEKIDPKDAKFIARSDKVEVWQPLTRDGAKALAHLGMPEGRYAAWCTNNGSTGREYGNDESYWKSYTTGSNPGKLFIFTSIAHPDEEKYQAHMKASDGRIDIFLDIHDRTNKSFRDFVMENNLYEPLMNSPEFKDSPTFRDWRILQDLADGKPFEFDGRTSISEVISAICRDGNIENDDVRTAIKKIKVADGVTQIRPGALQVNGGLPNAVELFIPVVENPNLGKTLDDGTVDNNQYVQTDIGVGSLNEANFPNPEFKIRTIKHRLGVKGKESAEFVKQHISWIMPEQQEALSEEVLREDYSPSMPGWLKDAFNSSKANKSWRNNNNIFSNAMHKNIDLAHANFIEGEIPSNYRDDRLKEPNIPFFRVKMYKHNISDYWGRERYGTPAELANEANYVYQVYAKGVNDEDLFLLKGDSTWRGSGNRMFKFASMKQLLAHCVNFCYLDGNDPQNYTTELKAERNAIRKELPVNYNRGKGQVRDAEYAEWDDNGNRYRDSHGNIKPRFVRWKDTYTQTRGEDKSGYIVDPEKYKKLLISKGIMNYNSKLDKIYHDLIALRTSMVDTINNAPIKDYNSADLDIIQNLNSYDNITRSWGNLVKEYQDMLKEIDKASAKGDDELKEVLKDLFIDDHYYSKSSYAELQRDIRRFQNTLDNFVTMTIESFEDYNENEWFFEEFDSE